MTPEHIELITAAALKGSNEFSVRSRVFLYRGLAEFCGDQLESRTLLRMAEELENADKRCIEFAYAAQITCIPAHP